MSLPSADAKAVVRALEGLTAAVQRVADSRQSDFVLSTDELAEEMPLTDICRPVQVDGETILIRGSGEFTEQERGFAAEIVRAAKRKYAAEHPGVDADVTQMETTARVFAGLYESAGQDVARVIALYEQWVKAGPPPLGASMARWWDARLVELYNAILPTDDQPKES